LLLIVGLGNPGLHYVWTRHNVGWLFVDWLVEETKARLQINGRNYMLWGPVSINGRDVAMMKPTTYMNRSGSALRNLPEGFIQDASEVLVVYDDVAIPFGRMRLRKKGSAGGHNGMMSVLAALGTLEVPRLRIGIGTDTGPVELSEFVLSEFTEVEKEKLPVLFEKGIEVVSCVVNGDWDKGMQIANSFVLNA